MQSPPIKLLTQELLDEVVTKSRHIPRQRLNYNFHDLSEKVQRFVNVLQPGTYVRPHRHLRPDGVNGFEFFVVIQGELGMIIFNENGQILRSLRLSAAGPTRAVELPEDTVHTLVALAADTAILEFKEGPILPAIEIFGPIFPLRELWLRGNWSRFGKQSLKRVFRDELGVLSS